VAVIDGLTVQRTTNDFSDVIAGVSISLLDAQPGTNVQFTVESDKTAVKGKIKEFVDAYNEVVKFISKQNQYDEEKGAGGPLFGDNALSTIQRTLRTQLFGQSAAQVAADTTGYGSLRLLGVEQQADGTLKINDTKMNEKMDADLDAFADFFVDRDGFDNNGAAIGTDRYYFDTTADTGFGDDLARAIDAVVRSYGNASGQFTKGLFDGRVDSLKANIKTYDSRIEQRETRLEKMEAQLVARFASLESLMARLQSQSSFLNR
jgi:flagellar hook-associated protein 2